MMNVESLGSTAATMGGGFFVGILIGYALKKVTKLLAIIYSITLIRRPHQILYNIQIEPCSSIII